MRSPKAEKLAFGVAVSLLAALPASATALVVGSGWQEDVVDSAGASRSLSKLESRSDSIDPNKEQCLIR